jgi:hypothetical protein
MLHLLVDHWGWILASIIAAATIVFLFKLIAALGGSHSGADWP